MQNPRRKLDDKCLGYDDRLHSCTSRYGIYRIRYDVIIK